MTTSSSNDREQILDEIRSADRFLLATHENVDGDALGSLVAMQGLLTALGKESKMFMSRNEFPLPYEYEFFNLDGLVSVAPEDIADRTIIFLDCGNIDRNPADALKFEGAHILNVDHHHDNTRFGTVNYVVGDASCTAEIVWDLMKALGVEASQSMAEALYVGLVTDTGRFMYENTGVRGHQMAADLIDAGVDVHAIYRRLYEGVPFAKLALLARGLDNIERYDDGLLTITYLSQSDFKDTGAQDSFYEGVVDHLRAVEGTAVAGLVRELPAESDSRVKVSLRSTDGRVDVSRIAREQGGGGHRQAAGFSTDLEWDALIEFIQTEIDSQLAVA